MPKSGVSSQQSAGDGTRPGYRDVLVALFLAALAIAIYYPLTLQGRVLSSLDSLVYFYPNAIYLAERLRAGQIPLWDPYIFAGVPFLANSQVGALYPPNLLYLLGPVSRVYAILVVAHVWWLGFGVYLVARGSLGLGRLAGTFAAIAVAFGGFVGGMNGHLNQLEALSWAPLAILLVERGAVHASWRIEVLAALPFALAAVAGHSQELYMTGVVAELAGFSRVIQRRGAGVGNEATRHPDRRAKGQRSGGLPILPVRVAPAARPPTPNPIFPAAIDLLRLTIGPVLGVLIAGAQLVPTLELTRLSMRATGLDFANAASFSLPPPLILTTMLPTIGQLPPSTEWLGYVGVATIVVALVGLWRRPSAVAWWLAALALLGLFLAFGKYTPLFDLAFKAVPGVGLFRVPARWLTLWTIGMGLLGGWGLEALVGVGDAGTRPRLPAPLRPVGLAVALFTAGALAILVVVHRQVVSWPSPATLALWATTLVGLAVIFWLARRWATVAAVALVALLVGELGVASLGLPFQQAIWLDGVEVQRLSVDHLLAQHSPDRIFALGDNTFDPGDLAALRRMLAGTLPPDAIAEYVTAVKHVEGLTPNLSLRFGLRTIDGYDGGLLPLDRYDDLKQLFPTQAPPVADGRLRLQLKSAPDPRLLGWLNVRYLLINRLRDQWIDGVYYDLAVTQPVQPAATMSLPVGSAFPTTTLGVMLRGADGSVPVGSLRLDAGGETVSLPIGAGKLAGKAISSDVDPRGLWLWTVDLTRPEIVQSVSVTWQGSEPIALRSLSLIDRRTGANESVVVSPAYRLDFVGDVKIYEDRDVLPRAFLATGLDVVPNSDAVVAELSSPSWNAQETAVAAAQDVPPSTAFRASDDPGQARIVDDEPERVAVATNATGQRVLVLTDSFYPGWQATVDGVVQPILPVNTLFRGVILGPGTHQVVFSYQPRSWALGLALSAVGICMFVAALVVPRRGDQ